MQKKAISVIALALSVFITQSVYAEECSYDRQVELNTEASTVKVTYKATEIDNGDFTYDVNPETNEIDFDNPIPYYDKGFKIQILNVTKNLIVNITNAETGESKVLTSANAKDGVIEVFEKTADRVYNYNIEIISNTTDNSCSSMNLRTMTLKVPKYNIFSELEICQNKSKYELCQEYITVEGDVTYNDVVNNLPSDALDTKDIKEPKKKKENFYEKNKKEMLIIGGCVIIMGVATAGIVVYRKRSRLI